MSSFSPRALPSPKAPQGQAMQLDSALPLPHPRASQGRAMQMHSASPLPHPGTHYGRAMQLHSAPPHPNQGHPKAKQCNSAGMSQGHAECGGIRSGDPTCGFAVLPVIDPLLGFLGPLCCLHQPHNPASVTLVVCGGARGGEGGLSGVDTGLSGKPQTRLTESAFTTTGSWCGGEGGGGSVWWGFGCLGVTLAVWRAMKEV